MMAVNGLALAAGEGRTLSILGNKLTFKVENDATSGAFAALEYEVGPRFGGPPMHLHERTDELFYVLEGTVSFTLDGRTLDGGPGTTVFVPRGTPHTFANHADGPARFFEVALPGQFVGYFDALHAALPATGGPPDPETIAALYAAYDTVPVD
jgi:mannose-6-phosphate isomerase-like protein (cupin superfamily)